MLRSDPDSTHIFTATDFDVDKILRNEMILKLDLIERLDDSRDSVFNITEAVPATGNQCDMEMDIRCVTGMTAGKLVYCPTALMSSDSMRKMEWKKFRDEVKTKKPLPQYFNWTNRVGTCERDQERAYHEIRKMYKML